MRKIYLTMKEQNVYEVIKKVAEEKMKKTTAEVKLNLSRRQIDRLVKKYKENGKQAFIHGNRNSVPNHALSMTLRAQVLALYQTKYFQANFSHFTELLAENEGIIISRSAVANIMKQAGILSPKAHRVTKRRHRQNLKKKAQQLATVVSIQDDRTLMITESHPSRPRKKYFGELIQMDASLHQWFGIEKCHLHIAIDDSTGNVVGASFAKEETLRGYYEVYHQILSTYGIPYEFLTDRRTVFEYERKKTKKLEEDTFTQFGYACQQLGTKITTTSVPQAKGRVERLFGTLQSRLITELSIRNITNMEDANAFLNSYIKKYNTQFGSKIDYNKSVFEKTASKARLNLILGILSTRKIDAGHHFRYRNQQFIPTTSGGKDVYYVRGTEVLVIQAFNGEHFVTINDTIYSVRQLETHELESSEFDLPPEPKKAVRKHIPPMTHPWRVSYFKQYLGKAGVLLESTTPNQSA